MPSGNLAAGSPPPTAHAVMQPRQFGGGAQSAGDYWNHASQPSGGFFGAGSSPRGRLTAMGNAISAEQHQRNVAAASFPSDL